MKNQKPKRNNSFRLVKSQPQSFELFQENFLCKVLENSPPQSQRDNFAIHHDNLHIELASLPQENIQRLKSSSSLDKIPSKNAENIIDNIINKNTSPFFSRSENSGDIDANFFHHRKVHNSPKGNFVDVMDFHDEERKIYNNNLLEFHMRKEDSTVIPYVKKFMSKLKNVSSFRSIGQLKKSNFLLVADSSYFHEEVQRNQKLLEAKGLARLFFNIINFYSSQKYKFKKGFYFKTLQNSIFGHKMILHPYQNIKILWDVLHLIIIIMWFFYSYRY